MGMVMALLLFAVPAGVHACSCALLSSEEKFEGADVVVRGTIVGLGGGPFKFLRSSSAQAAYQVRVSEVLKGDVDTALNVRSGSEESLCGYAVHIGEEHELYLVSSDTEDEYTTGFCSGNELLSSSVPSSTEAVPPKDEPSLWGRILHFLQRLF